MISGGDYVDFEKTIFATTFTFGVYIDNVIWYGDNTGKLYKLTDSNYIDSGFVYETHYYPTKYGMQRNKIWSDLFLLVETDTILTNMVVEWTHLQRYLTSNSYDGGSHSLPFNAVWNQVKWDQFKWNQLSQSIIRIRHLGKSQAIKLRISVPNAGST